MTCTAASLKFPNHAGLIQQINAIKLPYTLTSKDVEQKVAGAVIKETRLTTPTRAKYESACLAAVKEMGSDFQACAKLSYPRGAGKAMKPQGCKSGYKNTGLLCSKCTGTFPWQWKCHTYAQSLRCSSGLQEQSGLCYKPCESGYTGVGPVCWLKNTRPTQQTTAGRVKAVHGICLDAPKRSTAGSKVHMWDCSSTNKNQQWTYNAVTGQIRNRHGICLDASQRSTKGGNVHMWACNTANKNQQWEYNSKSRQIRNRHGICLDAPQRSTKGGKLHMWECDTANKNQQWQIA